MNLMMYIIEDTLHLLKSKYLKTFSLKSFNIFIAIDRCIQHSGHSLGLYILPSGWSVRGFIIPYGLKVEFYVFDSGFSVNAYILPFCLSVEEYIVEAG